MRWVLVDVPTTLNPIVGDIALSETNRDLLFFTADQSDLETVQRLRTRFGLFRGEWFADKRVGTPWYQRILGRKDVSDAAKRAIFARIIRGCPGVASVDSIVLSPSGPRQLRVDFKARLISGFLLDSAKVPAFIVAY